MDKFLDLTGLTEYDQLIKNYVDKNKTQVLEFSLRIDDDGNLVCDYPEGTEQPNFTINSEGMLVYTY